MRGVLCSFTSYVIPEGERQTEKNHISIFLLSFQSFCIDNVYMYVLLLCKKL